MRRLGGSGPVQAVKHSEPAPPRRPVASLDQDQETGARIADARGSDPPRRPDSVRLPLTLGQLLQNLLKHLGRVVLTTSRTRLATARSSALES